MYRVWTASAGTPDALARSLEMHLNEFAEEIVAVSYAVTDAHHVLAVYRAVDLSGRPAVEAAVAVAEELVSGDAEPT